jgi:hypothetical protein
MSAEALKPISLVDSLAELGTVLTPKPPAVLDEMPLPESGIRITADLRKKLQAFFGEAESANPSEAKKCR